MKTMTKIALLLTAVAAGNSAMAQVQKVELPAGMPYIFRGGAAAVGAGTMSYQWFRDGQPIAGATDSTYILLDYLAYGTDVEFKCGAISNSCPGTVNYSNIIRTAFGLKVGSIFWASVNVGNYNQSTNVASFASRPDMYTVFFQWSRSKPWAADGTVADWNNGAITDLSWSFNPCPAEWRLPTQAELMALSNTGSTWAEANTRGNAVAGRFYGPNNAKCSLPNDMYNCVFFPASGYRENYNGALAARGYNGYYWSSTEANSTSGYYVDFSSTYSIPVSNSKVFGFNVRCVR